MSHGEILLGDWRAFLDFELAVCDECPECAGCRGACRDGLWDHHSPCGCEDDPDR
jgi:hypothetical protein